MLMKPEYIRHIITPSGLPKKSIIVQCGDKFIAWNEVDGEVVELRNGLNVEVVERLER